MPSISAHMIVAKIVANNLNINSNEFIKGNILPDIIDLNDSHHKIKSNIYMIPDIDYFLNIIDFNNDLQLGYLTHLLLDKYYLKEYLEIMYPQKNMFIDSLIYKDYDFLNYLLIEKFNLDINELEKLLNGYDCKIIEEKLKYNIECLKNNKIGKTKYLDLENFSQFLVNVSNKISEELLNYADKSSMLYVRVRQSKK